MKLTPVQSPHQIQQTGVNPQAQNAARQRAIATLNGQQPAPVQNQSQVAMEEIGAVIPKPNIQTKTESTPTPEPVTEPQTAQPVPVEKVEVKENKEEPQLSERIQQLIRREKQQRIKAQRQEEEFKRREAELKAKEASLKPQEPDLSQYIPKSRLKESLMDVLSEQEIPLEEVTKQLLEAPQRNPRYDALLAKQEARIAQLQQQIEQQQKQAVESQDAAYKAAVNQLHVDVKGLVKDNPSYEAIRFAKAERDVVDLIEKVYKAEGRIMDVEEAANEVETYLIDSNYEFVNKVNKLKTRFTPPAKEVKPKEDTTPKQTPMKTLTNANSSTRQLSARERAILAFKGENKS